MKTKPKRKLKTEVEYFSVINRRMQKQEDVWSDVSSLLKYLEVVLHEAKSVKITEV